MGYARAGFEVVGVDIKPQPRYPFAFYQYDALEFLGSLNSLAESAWWPDDFDAIHASPPCQRYSRLAKMHPAREYPDLIGPTREALHETGLPFVIENIEGAPLAHYPTLDGLWGIILCGSMFGLGVERGELRRHRAFEANFPLVQPQCRHRRRAVGVYGHGGHSGKHRMLYRDEAAEAMEIAWANRDEMAQAIPPAYTELIGHQLIQHLKAQAAA
jgi:DNA (cytosine-5)-methyltransferase 1